MPKALLATAQEKKTVDQVATDMEAVYTTLGNSHELKAVLDSPVISAELKGETLQAIFCEKLFALLKPFWHLSPTTTVRPISMGLH
jgi:F0F1-type ATP synthase delta subunit